jgi:hypothetical protein
VSRALPRIVSRWTLFRLALPARRINATERVDMIVLMRNLLLEALVVVCAIPGPALAAQKPGAPITITAAPGTLVRWHNARIDPMFRLEDPDKIPSPRYNPHDSYYLVRVRSRDRYASR